MWGPEQGESVSVSVPRSDVCRGGILWLILLGLLILSPAYRSYRAWSLLGLTVGICLLLQAVNYGLSCFVLFHWHIKFFAVLCETLQFLAVSLAILLCVSPRIDVRSAFLRFMLLLVFLEGLGCIATLLNPWTFLPAHAYPLFYAVWVGIFWMGHSAARSTIRRMTSPQRSSFWYLGWCLFWGLVPVLVLSIIQYVLSRSLRSRSTMDLLRTSIGFCSLFFVPYTVYAAFLLLAARSPFWKKRLDCL